MNIRSNELVKEYTKMIICSYLYKKSDCLSNIFKQILIDGDDHIKISSPSLLVALKELENEDLVTFSGDISKDQQNSICYELTESGKEFYLNNYEEYIKNLMLLKDMIERKN